MNATVDSLDLTDTILGTLAPLKEQFIESKRYYFTRICGNINEYIEENHAKQPYGGLQNYIRAVMYSGNDKRYYREKAYYREKDKWAQSILEALVGVQVDVSKEYPKDHPIWGKVYQSGVIHKTLYKPRENFEQIVVELGTNAFDICKAKAAATLEKKLAPYKGDIVSLTAVSFNQGCVTSDGVFHIEGVWSFVLNDGRKGVIKTKAITAGGYNIQCLHVRYTVNVKVG